MVRCKDCKHWNTAIDWHAPFGFCTSNKWVGGYGIEPGDLPSDAVHHEDDEGWGFTTGPDFGCVHGETK